MKKNYYIIDRIEDNILVCERYDGTMVDILIDKLVNTIPKEGMVLIEKDDKLYFDKEETERKKQEIENLMKELWN